MDTVHDAVRWLHVTLGFLGLAAFWLPVFMRKGGRGHIFFGRVFLYCGYVVLVSAMIGVALNVIELQQRRIGLTEQPDTYGFLFFLGYLALVTLIHDSPCGRRAQDKEEPESAGDTSQHQFSLDIDRCKRDDYRSTRWSSIPETGFYCSR